MKITVEFDSMQELDDFCNGVAIAPSFTQKAIAEAPQPAQEEPKAEKPKKSTPKKAEAQEEAKTEAPAEANVHETEKDADKDPVKEDAPAASGHTDGELKILLSEKLKAGKKAEVKKLFDKHGVTCLTDLIAKEKDNLDAVYAEAEVI